MTLLLGEDDTIAKRLPLNVWVHPDWQKRSFEGKIAILYKELMNDESIFY